MSHLPSGARVGLIAEGSHDLVVIADWTARFLRPDLVLDRRDHRELGKKPELLRLAPEVAGALLDAGCAHVVVAWDLAPYGDEAPTREEDLDRFWSECDREDAKRITLGVPKLDRARICPVVIVQELESWLLADERALSAYLSTRTHRVRVNRCKRPEREANPKTALKRIFQTSGREKYVDYLDARRLGACVQDDTRLRDAKALPSFQTLVENVEA